MQVKGSKPITLENIPEGQTLIQIAFRKDGTVYNANIVGPTDALVASAKMRGIVLQNVVALFVTNAAGVHGFVPDATVDAPGPEEMREITRPDENVKIITDLGASSVKTQSNILRKVFGSGRGNA